MYMARNGIDAFSVVFHVPSESEAMSYYVGDWSVTCLLSFGGHDCSLIGQGKLSDVLLIRAVSAIQQFEGRTCMGYQFSKFCFVYIGGGGGVCVCL